MLTTVLLAVFVCLALGVDASERKERAQTCTYIANAQPDDAWPIDCSSDPEGAYCLTGNKCGCQNSYDCFVNTRSPFCSGQACAPCGTATGTTAVDLADHFWCREDRYPSLYVASSQVGPLVNQRGENVAGTISASANFYREVCLADGSCARCDQANSAAAGTTGVTFPPFAGFTLQQSKDAAWGTIWCNFIRGQGTTKPGNPICASAQLWIDVGLNAKVQADYLTTSLLVAWQGDDGPVTPGLSKQIIGQALEPAGTGARQKVVIRQPMVNWAGSCIPCRLFDSSAGGNPTVIPATATRFNYLCSRALATRPICDAADGVGCRACATNAECGSSTGANCATDGSASCTGGANCMADGSCRTCTNNADCATDGGEIPGQAQCNVATGICEAAFRCGSNFGGTTSPCPTAALPNCNNDGTCIRCATNGNCGATDLGTQVVCNAATGICGGCQVNADCSAAVGGANCMADGTCRDCTAALCAVNSDGGLPANGIPAGCSTAGGFCADNRNQVVCNTATRLCEDPCLSNNWCAGRATVQAIGGGNNCMLSGLCINCGNVASNAASCVGDGPLLTLAGSTGVANQPDCGANGICVTPFRCTTNPSCVGAGGGNNCQVDGTCVSCVVTYTTTTCGLNLDGGEIVSQPNCNQATRLCVGACTNNAGCAGTQGNNCMSNGVCFTCRSNADCTTGNAWGGDGGEVTGQSICNLATGICISACTGNFGTTTTNPCIAGAANCHSTGLCANCVNDADCAAQDGPPNTATRNTVCNTQTGICIDPFSCGTGATSTDNAGCVANYPGGANNNCNAGGTCLSCTTNALCYANDGGRIPNQPRCDATTKTCVSCTSNSDCPASAGNCNSDGLCYDCRKFAAGTTCLGVDGPPGRVAPNQNCDTVTGVCVDFCTQDSHCTDSCYPRCQVERGCCVECTQNSHCPVAQWRGSERTKTQCDPNNGYICIAPFTTDGEIVCYTDSDCVNSAGGPACSPTENICVECLYDSHCGPGLPACSTNEQVCVQCVSDAHCEPGSYCGSDEVCYLTETLDFDSAVSVSAGFLPLLMVLFLTF